jgi:putative nucleotidyltransferase with HDIG domain
MQEIYIIMRYVMNRIGIIWGRINEICMRTDDTPNPVYWHLFEVSQIAAFLALNRNENAELAAIAGLLHDISKLKGFEAEPYYAKQRNSSEKHPAEGAEIAMKMLVELGITSAEENAIICNAIKKHGDKDNIDTPFDEILKDADMFRGPLFISSNASPDEITSAYSYVNSISNRPPRWDRICKELGIINRRPDIECTE